MGEVWAVWVDNDLSAAGGHDQVHVFHGHGAQEDLVAEYEGADKATAVLQGDLDGTDVGYQLPASVGSSHLALTAAKPKI